MIFDHLDSSELYHSLGKRFAQGFAYLRNFDLSTPIDRYALDGDRLYAMVQEYETAPASTKQLEAHRRYADIQYVAKGRETIVYAPLHGIAPATDYNEEKDVAFFPDTEGMSTLHMPHGYFAVFFPEDGHKPCCPWGESSTVRKVVLKVLLEE